MGNAKSPKDVQKFNGFCNFNCWYVWEYSKVAWPITRLIGNVLFKWGLKEQAAFDELKCLIASEEVTTQPWPIGKFHLKVNASGYALGGIFSQLQDDNGTQSHLSRTPWPTPNSTMTFMTRNSLPLCMLYRNGTLTSLMPARHSKSGQITKTFIAKLKNYKHVITVYIQELCWAITKRP